jgi:hypothetical protein
MSFVESTVEGRTAVSAGAEGNQLIAVAHVGLALEILFLQPRHVDQHFARRRFARKR